MEAQAVPGLEQGQEGEEEERHGEVKGRRRREARKDRRRRKGGVRSRGRRRTGMIRGRAFRVVEPGEEKL